MTDKLSPANAWPFGEMIAAGQESSDKAVDEPAKDAARPVPAATTQAPTPRTDAVWEQRRKDYSDPGLVMRDHASQLERELAASQEAHKYVSQAYDAAMRVGAEARKELAAAQAKFRSERNRAEWHERQSNGWKDRAKRAEAELKAIEKRLAEVGSLARRLTYALKRSHTNEKLCEQSVDLLKRFDLGGHIVRTL